MTRRGQAPTVVLAVMFVVAACWALFAYAAPAQADACGLTHVWATAKPATEGFATLVVDGASLPAELVRLPRPDAPIPTGASDWCDFRPGQALTEPVDTRAPPLA